MNVLFISFIREITAIYPTSIAIFNTPSKTDFIKDAAILLSGFRNGIIKVAPLYKYAGMIINSATENTIPSNTLKNMTAVIMGDDSFF